MTRSLLATLVLSGCSSTGSWTHETWGEPFIEDGIPAAEFSDGCAATFDRFLVTLSDQALIDDAGETVAALEGAVVQDLASPGPHELGTLEVPSGTWRRLRTVVAPHADATPGNTTAEEVGELTTTGASMLVSGQIVCDGDTVSFTWPLTTATTYDCDPENLVVGAGLDARSQFTVHGDHLFYDSLVDPDAVLQGQAYVDADDGDGMLTVEELVATSVDATGLDTGGRAEVQTLWDYLQAASRTVGHIDGEGHCGTD